MALSEYELRILQEIETDLRPSAAHRLRTWWAAFTAHRAVIGQIALAIGAIVLLALFATAPVAAPMAAAMGASVGYVASGYVIRARRRRAIR